jgi:hypothetical protein
MSILLLVTMTVALQPCGICAFNVPAVHNRMLLGARSFASTTLQSDRILGAMTRGLDARGRRRFGRTPSASPLAAALRNQEDEEDDDDEEDLVRVPRRRRGGAAASERRFNEDDRDFDDEPSSPRRQGRSSSLYDEEEDDGYDSDFEDDEDFDDDDDEDWALDLRDIDTAALLENVVIPNPLLDSIDPDGAADRFPELARDPKFWLDMALFIAFLNFLSWAGPRDPYPDLPWF